MFDSSAVTSRLGSSDAERYAKRSGAASARVLFNARWIVTAAEGDLLEELGWSAEGLVGQRVARLLSRPLRKAMRPVLHVLPSGASARADVMHEDRLLHLDVHQVTPTENGAVARLDMTDLTWDAESEHARAHVERLEAIGYVAAGISHEINTPVQFVSDNLQFMEQTLRELLGLARVAQRSLNDDALPPAQLRARLSEELAAIDTPFIESELKPALDAVRAGLGRISRVAGDLRSFARPQAGNADVVVSAEIALAAGLVRRELQRLPRVIIDVATDLPVLPGRSGELAKIMVSVLREVSTRACGEADSRRATDEPDLVLHVFARRGWLFIDMHFRVPSHADDALGGTTARAADAPLRPMLADGFNLARALLREHYGGHLVVVSRPDSRTHLNIGLPLRTASHGGE